MLSNLNATSLVSKNWSFWQRRVLGCRHVCALLASAWRAAMIQSMLQEGPAWSTARGANATGAAPRVQSLDSLSMCQRQIGLTRRSGPGYVARSGQRPGLRHSWGWAPGLGVESPPFYSSDAAKATHKVSKTLRAAKGGWLSTVWLILPRSIL